MFILYGKHNGIWKKITLAVDKNAIVNSMINISSKHNFYDFKVLDTSSEIEEYVIGAEQLKLYLEEYKKRIKPLEDLSCVDLKRYILDKKRAIRDE